MSMLCQENTHVYVVFLSNIYVDFAIKAFSDTIVASWLTPEKQSSAAIRKRIRAWMQ